ncbi:hypothetical protein AB9P05_14410 [Roseivirga sp. BDSF3-8]|uniref:hypothetical protein n=1 Tax=Roseivirga sp. BDSF3-8 TaxID=3241598 RepID=UPI00353214BF
MTTKILTVVFFVIAIGLGGYLVWSINDSVQQEARIETVEEAVKNKLMLIRDAQIAYQAVNGQYTSEFPKLINFVDTGKFYLVQRKENIITLDYGADSIYIEVDTLGTKAVKDSLFSNPDYQRFNLKNLAEIPGSEKEFEMRADKVMSGNIEVDVFMVRDTDPVNPRRRENNNERALQVGSLTEATTSGNWQ